MFQDFGGTMSCGDCWKAITHAGRLAAKAAKMEAALAEDGAGDAHSDFLWSRAVTVG